MFKHSLGRSPSYSQPHQDSKSLFSDSPADFLEPPTQPMKTEAAEAGFYESLVWQKRFPQIQIVTIEEVLSGKQPLIPAPTPYTKAERIPKGKQPELI